MFISTSNNIGRDTKKGSFTMEAARTKTSHKKLRNNIESVLSILESNRLSNHCQKVLHLHH